MQIEPGSETERRVLTKLVREMGPLVQQALQDPRCEDVMLNDDGQLWVKRQGEPTRAVGTMACDMAEAMMKTLSSYLDEPIDRLRPIVSGEMPVAGGIRFMGTLPPVAKGPTFSMRKAALKNFTLEQYVQQGSLSDHHWEALRDAVRNRLNILVMGGTGAGKTTLTNALTAEIVRQCPDDRVVLLEDLPEIRCAAANKVRWRTLPDTSMADLLRATLRMRPDRIIVGEVRGAEALDLLRAWGTGHPGGLSTLHANDAVSGLTQLETLVSMNDNAPSDGRIASVVALNVDVVVHITETRQGRRVREVLRVLGHDGMKYETQPL